MTRLGITVDADGPERTFWEGVEHERLLLQRCERCDRTWHPPAERCPSCGSAAHHWIEASGDGRVYSFTTVHHAAHPAMMAFLPYTIVLVDLAEGPRIASRLTEGSDAAVGRRVQVRFERYEDSTLPLFEALSNP